MLVLCGFLNSVVMVDVDIETRLVCLLLFGYCVVSCFTCFLYVLW